MINHFNATKKEIEKAGEYLYGKGGPFEEFADLKDIQCYTEDDVDKEDFFNDLSKEELMIIKRKVKAALDGMPESNLVSSSSSPDDKKLVRKLKHGELIWGSDERRRL